MLPDVCHAPRKVTWRAPTDLRRSLATFPVVFQNGTARQGCDGKGVFSGVFIALIISHMIIVHYPESRIGVKLARNCNQSL